MLPSVMTTKDVCATLLKMFTTSPKSNSNTSGRFLTRLHSTPWLISLSDTVVVNQVWVRLPTTLHGMALTMAC